MYNDTKKASDRIGRKPANRLVNTILYILLFIALLGAMHADYNALQLGLIN